MRTRPTSRTVSALSPLAAAALLALAPPAGAASRYWTFISGCGSADWFGTTGGANSQGQFTCWSASSTGGSGAPAPTAVDDVFILQPAAAAPLLVNFAASSRGAAPFASAASLTMYGSINFAAGMTMDRGTLLLDTMNVGAVGLPFLGRFDQTGSAAVTAMSGVNVLAGEYNLNGGSLVAPLALSIRAQGAGASFTQRGGTLTSAQVSLSSEGSGNASFSQLAGTAASSSLNIGVVPGHGSSTFTIAGGSWTNNGTTTVGGTAQGRLDVTAGRLATGSLGVGLLTGGIGQVNVQGSAAQLDVSGQINLGGVGGSATLRVTDGARLTGTAALIDMAPAEGQTLLVSGAGSRVDLGGALTLGVLSGGSAAALDGGHLASASATLGADRRAVGNVRVSGAGSQWTVGSSLLVGGRGFGVLAVDGGGTVSSASASLGDERFAVGSVLLAGGSWQNQGGLTVGKAGLGTLVQAGGLVSAGNVVLADAVGSRGTVSVQGPGTLFKTGGPMTVGRAGAGDFTLGLGASAEAASLTFGELATGSGRGSVGGLLTVADVVAVGLDGSGELSVTDGGRLNSQLGVIGKGSGTGSVDVGGQRVPARWNVGGPLTIGQGTGSGKLVLRENGQVEVADLTRIGARGAVVLDGGTLVTGALQLSPGGNLSWNSGALTITGDQGLTLGRDGIPARWDIGSGRALGVNATLSVAQGGELRLVGGQLAAGRLALAGGRVSIGPGQTLDMGPVGELSGQGRVDGAIGGGLRSKITADGGELRVGSAASTEGFAFRGDTEVRSGTLRIDDADLAQLGQHTRIDAGGRLVAANGLRLGAGQELAGMGDAAVVEGRLVNDGIVGQGDGAVRLAGLVGGHGSFAGRVLFDAGYAPGDDDIVAAAFASGSAVFGSGSTLTLQIDGVSPRTGYDRLVDLGSLQFDGTLVLAFGDAFQTRNDARLSLLDFDSFSGSLDSAHVLVTGIDAARVDISQLASSGVLLVSGLPAATVSAVPEPGTVALWAAGLGGLAWRSRALGRRRRLEAVEAGEMLPRLFGALDEAEEPGVAGADHAGVDQVLEVDQLFPELAPEQQDRPRAALAGLDQRQRLEQFVEGAEAAGEAHQRDAAHHEVHLAQREVVELEAQLRRDVRVRRLLVRQHDVQADALAAHFMGAAIAGFHDAGAAAGDDVDRRLQVL